MGIVVQQKRVLVLCRYDNGITGGVISMVSTPHPHPASRELCFNSGPHPPLCLWGCRLHRGWPVIHICVLCSRGSWSNSFQRSPTQQAPKVRADLSVPACSTVTSKTLDIDSGFIGQSYIIFCCAAGGDPYCKYDSQVLEWFTSSLFIAGVFAALPAGYTTRQAEAPAH